MNSQPRRSLPLELILEVLHYEAADSLASARSVATVSQAALKVALPFIWMTIVIEDAHDAEAVACMLESDTTASRRRLSLVRNLSIYPER